VGRPLPSRTPRRTLGRGDGRHRATAGLGTLQPAATLDRLTRDTVPNDTVPNDTVPNDTVPNDTVRMFP